MARDRLIDFESQETHFLLNPRLPAHERQWLENSFVAAGFKAGMPNLAAHIWLASSGTTSAVGSSIKVVALSKRAFLIAAAAANKHLESSARDIWYNALPHFHVGGLAVHARALLSGARVITASNKWDATEFAVRCEDEKVTLTSLVPTQVYDLVHGNASAKGKGFKAPRSLRAILVGGGALDPNLYAAARHLGWPLLPTYGMTELCSQVATAPLSSLANREFPEAELLSHIEARVGDDGRLQLRSESLFTVSGHVTENGFTLSSDCEDGWYTTSDFCELNGRQLRFSGRTADVIKVGGEIVNLAKLRERFSTENSQFKFTFISEDCPRLGERVFAVTECGCVREFFEAVTAFNKSVAPFERVRGVYALKTLPRTELGKVRVNEIKALLK